jgi:hypothetical protein
LEETVLICVKQYVTTCFSFEDANKLQAEIQRQINSSDIIEIDFSDIKIFTTLFFNNALTKYVVELGPKKYHDKFNLINLSELGQVTYQYSLDNACDYCQSLTGCEEDLE